MGCREIIGVIEVRVEFRLRDIFGLGFRVPVPFTELGIMA